MPTDAENMDDPNMALIEIRGERRWVARADLRHTGSRSVGNLKFQGMTFTKNRRLLRSIFDPEYIAALGGGPDGGADPKPPAIGACCYRPPGQKQFCKDGLTEKQCDESGGTWMGADTKCVVDPFTGDLVCPKPIGGGMDPVSLASQSVNLDSSGAEMLDPWLVHDAERLTIQATLQSGTWNTAEVEIRGSIDGKTWTVIQTLTAIGLQKAIDVENYTRIQLVVSKVEGAAGTARFSGYGKLAMTSWG